MGSNFTIPRKPTYSGTMRSAVDDDEDKGQEEGGDDLIKDLETIHA